MKPLARAPIDWRLGVATALASIAVPATAQVAPAYAGFSKTDAILGGAPSAHAAILAQQARGVAPAAGPISAPAPASRGSIFRSAVAPLTSTPIALDRPDVFGSIAFGFPATSARSLTDLRGGD